MFVYGGGIFEVYLDQRHKKTIQIQFILKITRLQILLRPKAPLATTDILSIFSWATPELDSRATPELLPSCSRAAPQLIQNYSHLFLSYSWTTPKQLPSYFHCTLDMLSNSQQCSAMLRNAQKCSAMKSKGHQKNCCALNPQCILQKANALSSLSSSSSSHKSKN